MLTRLLIRSIMNSAVATVACSSRVTHTATEGSCDFHLHNDLRRIYSAGISAVRPSSLVERALQYNHSSSTLHCAGRTYSLRRNVKLVAFGKAVLGMTLLVADILKEHIVGGVVSIPVGSLDFAHRNGNTTLHLLDLPVKIYEGAPYNLPDETSLQAGKDILQLAKNATEDDLIISLVSGGGSALMSLPLDGVSLQEKTEATVLLSKAGASITELNIMRQCLSQVKGGKLAEAMHPAQVLSLILSDVIGDPLHIIASGPTVPSHTTPSAVRTLLSTYLPKIPKPLPASVISALNGAVSSSQTYPQTSSSLTSASSSSASFISRGICDVHNVLIGNNAVATKAAECAAAELGYKVIVWSHCVEGEAKQVGELYAKLASILLHHMRQPHSRHKLKQQLDLLTQKNAAVIFPNEKVKSNFSNLVDHLLDINSNKLCLISGGEPTVTVNGNGVGGRNQEMALSFACHIHGHLVGNKQEVDTRGENSFIGNGTLVFGCLGTDGQDGPCDSAGAVVDIQTWAQALKQGLDPEDSLLNNDSNTFFNQLNCGQLLIKTGLTGTNVMDLHVLLLSFDV